MPTRSADPRLNPSDTLRWEAAAQRLVSALREQADYDARSRLLERVAARFGDEHYLGFVQLLCAVQHFGDPRALGIVADALAGALARHRLPAGPIPAWGAPAFRPAAFAGGLAAAGGLAGMRRLGPIEFLCASLLQPGSRSAPPADQVEIALRCVIALVDASRRAVELYVAQLAVHADDPLQGTLNRRTRDTLRAIAGHWRAGDSPERIVRRGLAAGLAVPV
ncbi:MAG: hypothetical protein ACOYLX_04785 [Burkholderiaceae bacterium]